MNLIGKMLVCHRSGKQHESSIRRLP